jgi:hypothetical protein
MESTALSGARNTDPTGNRVGHSEGGDGLERAQLGR